MSKGLDISKLQVNDIGKWVVYTSAGGDKVELGRIKSWNHTNIFVVYNWAAEQPNWQDYTGAGTRPEDLEFKNE